MILTFARQFRLKLFRLSQSVFGFDNYPSLWFTSKDLGSAHPMSVPPIKKQSLFSRKLNNFRIYIWNNIAKHHAGFSPLYSGNQVNYSGPDSYLNELYEFGTVRIENFLSEEEYTLLMDDIRSIYSQSLEQYSSFDNDCQWFNSDYQLSSESKIILQAKVSNLLYPIFIKHVFPHIFVNFQKSDSSHFKHDCTSWWHADRFIPTIGVQYYPLGASWMPTERLLVSPSMTYYRAKLLQYHYRDISDCTIYDKSINITKQVCLPNTLYISFHHILHRRSITNTPGERLTIFFDFYNTFTRLDLFKSFLSKLFS